MFSTSKKTTTRNPPRNRMYNLTDCQSCRIQISEFGPNIPKKPRVSDFGWTPQKTSNEKKWISDFGVWVNSRKTSNEKCVRRFGELPKKPLMKRGFRISDFGWTPKKTSIEKRISDFRFWVNSQKNLYWKKDFGFPILGELPKKPLSDTQRFLDFGFWVDSPQNL